MSVSKPELNALLDSEQPQDEYDEQTRALAQTHQNATQSNERKLPLLQHPDQHAAWLRQARLRFARTAEEEITISYAGEWLLDNFYVVEQALRQVVEDLPDRYYAELPKLMDTSLAGLPRIYIVARHLLDTSANPLSIDQIITFAQTYQMVTPLTMGELWALPAFLRIVNLENLTWTVIQLTGIKTTGSVLYGSAIPAQPANETLVANSIINLRMLATQDWKAYFEAVSLVELVLRQDPAAVYAGMEFETRNRYRQIIEELAPDNGQHQQQVAQKVVTLAQQTDDDGELPLNHIGFYLLDEGRFQLEAAIGYRAPWQKRLQGWLQHHPSLFYLGSVMLLTLAVLGVFTTYAAGSGANALQIVFVLLLSLILAVTVGVNVINWLISRFVPPRVLPKMEFEQGIPAGCQAVVAVPVLLDEIDDANSLAHQLELHYLRNPDPHLRFALLADYADAQHQHMPDDDALLEQAQNCIRALNERYGTDEHQPFYLFLRERHWNPAEGKWMGWERKRGKLEEFNRLLLNPDADTSFFIKFGNLPSLNETKYVITLDADTVLPKDGACRLVATLAHPLNRARFAEDGQTVVAGYTVLQPRVEVIPTAANSSWFTRIFAGDTGLDLYTLAVSDVYQDLFGEGIFVGKGIYEVATLTRSLAGRIPENRLLSHDLFEGIHGRAGLVTDIVLLEDYPPQYLVHVRRLHRWIRGDWQLLPWLLPRVPHENGSSIRNPLTLIDRWKILDNLRRSLTAPSLFVLLIAGWLGLPGSSITWTLLVILMSATPFLTNLINQLKQFDYKADWKIIAQELRADLLRWLLTLIFLPYETFITLDAVLTTLVRLIQGKHLLQWTTAAHTVRLFGRDVVQEAVWRQMLTSTLFVAVLGIFIAFFNLPALLAASPLVVLWIASPTIAYWISLPVSLPQQILSEQEHLYLRALARRTWLYFEQFVGPEDHWLPPDHFQEFPRGIVAHQTSPTNIGMLLLSTLAAYDLGYMGLLELSTRFRLTFENLEQLERYQGHFLNWYDTRTLKPLLPAYVSTVDSGNLAGCLIALRQGFQDLSSIPIMRPQRWQGLLDTLTVLRQTLSSLKITNQSDQEALLAYLDDICHQISAVQHEPTTRTQLLSLLSNTMWPDFSQRLLVFLNMARLTLDPSRINDLSIYLERIRHHLHNMKRDLDMLLPWLPLLVEPPEILSNQNSDAVLQALWKALLDTMPVVPRFGDVTAVYKAGRIQLTQLQSYWEQVPDQNSAVQEARNWCKRLSDALDTAQATAESLLRDFKGIDQQAHCYLQEMNFRFLYNTNRRVFHIGYNLSTGRLDNSFYDLLASEARLTSFISIARGEVHQEHWLHMSRPRTRAAGEQVLLSWSGTMFEYLMPPLLMRDYPGTLLYESNRATVNYQISYARQRGVPWGISESGYYAFDSNQNYQYRAFGAPALAFKRGVAADLVIAPYASLLALPIQPCAVLENMQQFEQLQAFGTYGLYEAIDYTPHRLPLGQPHALVQEYMVHHQGMILLTLTNYLHDDIMVRRFHADPLIKSMELLLQEQIPVQADLQYPVQEDMVPGRPDEPGINLAPWSISPASPSPQVHILSNGRFSILITGSGSGYSQWQDIALTRWRADTTQEDWGTWFYLRDQDSGVFWSIGQQPVNTAPDYQNTLFYTHKAEFQHRIYEIASQMEITVAPDDDIEIRCLRLTNHSDTRRRLLVCSYSEVVLASQDNDRRHPAFNKLFIESEYLPEVSGLLFRRRPRSAHESPPYMVHMLLTENGDRPQVSYETDRAQFLGRNRTTASPSEVASGSLSGKTGATLDPIMALACEIEIAPHATVQVAFVTLVAASRGKAMEIAYAYRNWAVLDRVFNQARYQSEIELRRLDLDAPSVALFQRLLSALLYPQSALRAEPQVLAMNTKAQPGLWAFGISGDYPIIVVRVGDETELGLVRELILAHTYWRYRRMKVTLIILNQRDEGYTQELYNQVHRLIVRMGSETWVNRHDGIFILRSDLLNDADRMLLAAAARVYLDAKHGLLAAQLEATRAAPTYPPAFTPTLFMEPSESTIPLAKPQNLLFDNGFGGFSPNGREYVIYRSDDMKPPVPWINVIANPDFGFTVSEVGGGFTWAGNSSEHRLTGWRNDPVTDLPSEAIYLRDEETAQFWSPTPLPAGTDSPYLIRHGAGYSVFEHNSHGLRQQLTLFAAADNPVKIVRLRLTNDRNRVRRITITYYAEWVLGTVRDVTQQYIIPEFDNDDQTLLFRNPYSIDFSSQYAFITANKTFHGLTVDRTEFLGRYGNYAQPAALKRIGLSGTVRAGVDPCAAVQLHVDMQAGDSEEVFFLIGAGNSREEALRLSRQYRHPDHTDLAYQTVTAFWNDILTSITVQTPDPAMNVLLPWLLYQTLSCRIWGRSALYQSSGAFGFRDQLQDVMAVLHAAPKIAREHILRAAQHQFEAGDVLHWWHPPSGRGVRTRFSDDLVWLPFVAAHYVEVTGDQSILQEQVPFLKGEPLRPDEEERYGYYEATTEGYTLFEHCRRALSKGSTAGAHGLPLMGSGDWNDGMNRVGIEGKGESVWMGWFLGVTLARFADLCEQIGEFAQAATYRQQLNDLKAALEQHAWDGNWYVRAFYDDGTPLGSSQNEECKIDSIAQSWAVLSGLGDTARVRHAMNSVLNRLVKQDNQLLLLFTPPFDETEHDPGYIKGYPPGIRENGGQYTHAALWTIWAFAKMGDGEQAVSLFQMLNPINHSDTPAKAQHYRVEPYVVAADVYGVSPHTGRGGWTWYTGSSGWMYRLGVEAILGIYRQGDRLHLNPTIPKAWSSYSLVYRFEQATYHIRVENPDGINQGVRQVVLDGQVQTGRFILLTDEPQQHDVIVYLG